MTRSMSSDMQAALRDTVVFPVMLVYMQFTSLDLYVSDADFDISWNGHDWLGNGYILSIDGVGQSREQTAINFTVTLAGEDSTVVSLVLGETHQNLICDVYLALLDNQQALISDPFLIQRGLFDFATFNASETETTIVMSYENELISQDRAMQLRYTDQCQQSLFPGDTGFRYAAQAADFKGFWGAAPRVQYIKKRNIAKN